MVLVAGITIYLVFPSLAEVFGSFPKLTSLDPIWFTIAFVFQVAHFVCTIGLQRIALGTKAWFSVATSQLAGNAISLVVPGGAAFGAATQFRMLAKAGNDPPTAVAGLTVFSLLHRRAAGPADLRAAGDHRRHARSLTDSCTRPCWASWPSCSSPASAPSC